MSEYDNRRYQRQGGTSGQVRGQTGTGRVPGKEVRISGVPQSASGLSRQGQSRRRSFGMEVSARAGSGIRSRSAGRASARGAQPPQRGSREQDPRARARQAARRRKKRRRARMMRLAVVLVAVLAVVVGVVAFRGYQKGRQITSLKEEGMTAAESQDYRGAVEKFNEALALSGSKNGAEQIEIRQRLAGAQYGMKDYAASLENWKLLLESDEDNDEYKKNAVLCMIELGQYDDALGYGVLQGKVYNKMAVEKIRTGDYEGALNDIDRGLIVDDGSAKADLNYNQAVAYENQGEYEKALAQFESYISEFGADDNVQKEISFLKQQLGIQEETAEESAQAADEGETQAAGE